MRRYLILAFLFCLTLPFDLAVTGCTRNPAANFCDNLGYGNSKSNIASITLGPATTGISLPYGEVASPSPATAKSCTNTTVSVKSYAYGTSDMTIADINPTTGQVCAGTWNRQTAGGVAPYTTCLPTNKTGVALITASAGDVTSNTVPVYVHPQVGSIALAVTGNPTSSCPVAPEGNQCISQGCTATLDVTATAVGSTTPFCAPNSASVPDCASVLGAVTYNPAVGTIATIGTTTGTTNQATANQPGSTAITVSTNTGNVTGGATGSTAGYFYTCPPKTITLTANGGTSNNTVPLPVTPNNPESITATVTDINGVTITGLSLTYASTQPENVPVSSTGVITASYPSTASVTAYCQPPTCNPSPISQIGLNGNGTPIVSTPLLVKSSGTSSDVLYMGSPDSDYYSAIDFTIGQVSNPVKLPYKPNSMVLDPTGNSLYFGSYHELMVYTVANDASTLSKEDPTVPGVVLAVSPNNTTLLINDQNRGILYLYGVAGGGTSSTSTGTSGSTGGTSTATATGVITTYGGVGQRAQFSSDGQTVYIVGNNKLYIHNVFTGWSTVSLNATTGTNNTLLPSSSLANACAASIVSNNAETSALGGPTDANTLYNTFCSPDLSLAVPTVGPFVSGSPASESLGFCPNVTASPNVYYPSAGTLQASTDHLVATTNSLHVIGASVNPSPQLTDSATVVPTGGCPITPSATAGRGPVSSPLTIENTGNTAYPLTGYGITSIDQVIASPDSTLAFVTYMGTNTAGSAKLPAYTIPATGTAGKVTPVPLSGTAMSPIAGVFSPDTKTFYVSTTGDNLVHLISTSTLTDTSTLAPGLPDANGNITPAQFLATRARNQP
jgi:hypothetical protein